MQGFYEVSCTYFPMVTSLLVTDTSHSYSVVNCVLATIYNYTNRQSYIP